MPLPPLLQDIIIVCYLTTSFVTRNYNSVLCHYLICYKKLQECYVTTSFVTRNYSSVMSLPPLLQETISVLSHYLLCNKKL